MLSNLAKFIFTSIPLWLVLVGTILVISVFSGCQGMVKLGPAQGGSIVYSFRKFPAQVYDCPERSLRFSSCSCARKEKE